MPPTRATQNLHHARTKAQHTYVYISGFSSHHTLETGLAYYYRGHYIYAYPAGNLIEPVPFSTRRGIVIQGIVSKSALAWDAGAEGLGLEGCVGALGKSVRWEWEARGRAAAADGDVDGDAEPDISCAGDTTASPPSLSPANQTTAPTSLPAQPPTSSSTFTPRKGASFLASSAPGSRLASRAASPSALRPIASHVGLARLGGVLGPAPRVAEASSVVEEGSRGAVGWLVGLGDHALGAADSRASVKGRESRRVAPCAFFGEVRGGNTAKWSTEREWGEKGVGEEVPMLEGEGRMMVDWMRLLAEGKAGGGQ